MENKYLHNWISQLKKGILPYLVLRILEKERKYGYDLLKCINETLQSSTTDGTLYPMLIKMYDEGLLKYEWVEQTSGIPRKYYAMTPKGEQILAEMQKHIEQTLEIITKNPDTV